MSYRKLLALAFVLNGGLMIGMKAVSEFDLSRFIPMVLLFQYGLAAVAAGPGILARRRVGRSSIWVGAVAGISSAVGMSASIVVAGMMPGYIVFPIIQGGTLMAVVFIGRLAFKERIGPYGVAGIVAGIAAMALLSG